MSCLNDLKKGYRAYPIIDSHVHIAFEMAIGDTERFLESYMTYFGLNGLALMALPHSSRAESTDPANNIKALFLKRKLNKLYPERRIYAFGGMYHNFDARDTAEAFVSQLEYMKQCGFDGLKLLLGKPELRKRLGVGLDNKLLEGAWSFCERERFPVTLHLGDPAPFWENGKNGEKPQYSGDFPSLEQLRRETENVLKRHPDLDIVLCHFYFMSDEPERLSEIMSKYPNVKLDLTPGSEMYYGFTQNIDFWREFFIKYSDRILFGTDSDNWDSPKELERCEHSFSYPFNLVRNALEGEKEFYFEDNLGFGLLKPLSLAKIVLEDIYYKNLLRRLGEPKPVDVEPLKHSAEALLEAYNAGKIDAGDAKRRATERANLEAMLSEL